MSRAGGSFFVRACAPREIRVSRVEVSEGVKNYGGLKLKVIAIVVLVQCVRLTLSACPNSTLVPGGDSLPVHHSKDG